MSSEALVIAATQIAAQNTKLTPEEILVRAERLLVGMVRMVEGPLRPTPAVPIDESVHDDYLICLEDGEQVTLLKRHLATRYHMTPEEYREKWGLPDDYPMVTKTYSERRSQIAMEQGLGRAG